MAVSVTREARVYESDSPWSFYLDVAALSTSTGPWDNDLRSAARERIQRYGKELTHEIGRRSVEGRRALRVVNQAHRQADRRAQESAVEDELRAMTTGAGSGGAFVTPAYLTQNWVPALDVQPVFVRQTNEQPLPDFGLAAYAPEFQTYATATVQSAEGNAFSETDPTAAYASAAIKTVEAGVVISQQLSDRGRDSISFDAALQEQFQQQLNAKLDSTAISLVTATSTATVGTASAAALWTDVGNAVKRSLAVGTGTYQGRVRPTHLFTSSVVFEWLAKQSDEQGRPIITPKFVPGVPPWGWTGVADDDARWSGFTGAVLPNGIYVFVDDSIQNELLVCRPSTTIVACSEPAFRVLPASTYPNDLQLLAQTYVYFAVIDRVPGSSQIVTGWNVA